MVNSLLVSGHYLGEMIEKLYVDFGGANLGISRIEIQVLPVVTFLWVGFIRDLFLGGEKVTSIWGIILGHEWKELVFVVFCLVILVTDWTMGNTMNHTMKNIPFGRICLLLTKHPTRKSELGGEFWRDLHTSGIFGMHLHHEFTY